MRQDLIYTRSAQNFGTSDPSAIPLIPLFMTFTVLGAILNILLLSASIKSSNIRGLPVFINFSALFVLWSFGSGLMLLIGHPIDQHPPFGPCVIQAAAMYGNVSLLATGYFTLQASLYITIVNAVSPTPNDSTIRMQRLLVTIPYVSYIIVFVPRLIEGLQHPEFVSRVGKAFFCTIDDNDIFGDALRMASVILGIGGLFFEILAIRVFKKAYRGKSKESGSMIKALIIRVAGLTLWVVLCIIVSLASTLNHHQPATDDPIAATASRSVYDLVVSAVPLVNGLLFITVKDYRSAIRALFHWSWNESRRKDDRLVVDPYVMSSARRTLLV